MTDPTDPLSPAREAAVRRALADASGPVAIPDDVAQRIDGVLAELAAERTAGLPPGGVHESHPEAPAVVVPLDPAALRRRRRVRVLFGAAAAVAAIAVGVGIVSDPGSGEDAALSGLAEDGSARESAVAGSAGGDDQASVPEAAPAPSAAPPDAREDSALLTLQRVPAEGPLHEIRAAHLREDLVALQHLSLPHPSTADYAGTVLVAPPEFVCEPAAFGPGRLIGVQYDGQPAVVAFRAPVGTTQVAEVLACGTADVLQSTTLTATG
ncbi:hypothetical protein ACJ5H2_21620 [Nocardioides sp. R1-1]|uniref:hypothetical protein n=1 Tax=Nocardioides sp. R1-1 TaxID=3383502 RepID=UPI0038D06013